MKFIDPVLCRSIRCLVVIGGVLLIGTSLSAQVHRSRADTGQMTWGHQEYSRYTAAYCDRAVAEVTVDYRRVYVPDTSAGAPKVPQDSILPDEVIATARACGGSLTVEGTDPRELWPLARVLLVRGDEAQARVAIERTIALQRTSWDSAMAMLKAVKTLMDATPKRVTLATDYLLRLGAIGDSGKINLVEAHEAFADYWWELNIDSVRAHAERGIALLNTMNQSQKDEINDPQWPYGYLFQMANLVGDVAAAGKILERAVADGLPQWRNGLGATFTAGWERGWKYGKDMYGKKTRPLEGRFWINHHGVPQPAPGKISLVIQLGVTCGWECFEYYEMIKGLKATYGNDLEITLITATQGWLPGSGPLTPTEEAEGVARHFLKFLRLPVAVFVDETPFDTLPDGRRRPGESQLTGNVFPGGYNVLVTDREGKVVWLGGLYRGRRGRLMLNAVIARALRGTAGQSATGLSTVTHP